MTYFMGQDIEVYITTENTVAAGGDNGYVTVTDAGVATNRTGSSLDLSLIFSIASS